MQDETSPRTGTQLFENDSAKVHRNFEFDID